MRFRLVCIKVTIFLLSIVTVAQQTACPVLVEQALLAVGDNCAELNRNSACYGYDRVDASFVEVRDDSYFTNPADRASLVDLESIQTHPLDVEADRWGVAVMNLQANLPNTLPGQGVLVMLVGDSEVTNAIAPDNALQTIDPVEVQLSAEAPLFTSPSRSANTRDILSAGTTLWVDGYNPSLQFLRAVYENEIIWVETNHIDPSADLSAVPIVGASRPTPMQSFYFSTGIGQSTCQEADPMIAIQSPEGIRVDLTVNGVDIRVGSLITFRGTASDQIILTVHRGSVQTIFGNNIVAGNSSIGTLDINNNVIQWSPAQPATDFEQSQGQMAQDGFNSVARANGWDELSIPEGIDCSNGVAGIGSVNHVVQRGESLFTIAQQYDTSIPQIISTNGLDGTTIHSGLDLIIPNPCSGFEGITNQPVMSVPVDSCSSFYIQSPDVDAPAAPVPFYWTPLAGASSYRINLIDEYGQLGSTYTASTSGYVINTGSSGVGSIFSWQVQALDVNGNIMCSSNSPTILRTADPNTNTGTTTGTAGPTGPVFTANWVCNFATTPDTLIISWSGATTGDTIFITAMDNFPTNFTATQTSASGSVGFQATAGAGIFFNAAQATNQTTGVTIPLITALTTCGN